MSDSGRPGWGTRLFVALIGGFFGLAFGGVGLAVGVWPLLHTARMAWQVQDWQPVSAQVLSADLATSRGSKGGTTYAARVRYAYRYGGQDFESTRIGLDPGEAYDNIGDWHHDWVARLNDARTREQPVAAWVDPQQPAQAVLERRPRWGLLAFRLPFALIFTAVGVVAGLVMLRALAGHVPAQRRTPPAAAASSRTGKARTSLKPVDWHRVGQLSTRPPGSLAPPPWPAGTRGDLSRGEVRFVRRWPQVLGGVLAVVALGWLLVVLDGGGSRWVRLAHAVPLTALAALALHLLSLRWCWRLVGGQLELDRSSWLRHHVQRLTAQDLATLGHKLVFTSTTGNGPTVHHHALVAQAPGRPHVRLTPALADDGAQVVAWQLHAALHSAAV